MKLGRWQLVGNKHGFSLYRNTQAGMYNEQTVPQWFIGFNRKWYFEAKTVRAGTFYAYVRAIGPVVFGTFQYR